MLSLQIIFPSVRICLIWVTSSLGASAMITSASASPKIPKSSSVASWEGKPSLTTWSCCSTRLVRGDHTVDLQSNARLTLSCRFKQPIELLESTDTKENENGTMPAFRADCALSVEDRDGLEFSEWFSRGWKTRSEGGLGIQNEGPGSLGWCPDASQDWYGETNRWYTSVGLPMVSDALPPPYFPDLAKNTPGLEYKVYTKYHIVRHQPEQIRDYQPSGTFSSASSTATNSERSREEVQQAAKVNSNFTGLARKRPSLKPSVKNKSFLAALKRQKV